MIFQSCGNSSTTFPGAPGALSHYLFQVWRLCNCRQSISRLLVAKQKRGKQGMGAWYIYWYIYWAQKVWKCWSSKLQGKRRILHFIVDTSIATAAVSDFLELGSNLWNWKKCAKLEKVRKIGRNSNKMWTNLYHPCKILGNIVVFGSRTFSHFPVSCF